MARNPFWTRDELILALDLYFRINVAQTNEKEPEIVALSELLNALPIHHDRKSFDNFRTPDSVYMKLCNFLRFDPNYVGIGLDAGSKLDEVVWNEFASNQEMLQKTAAAIRHNYQALPPSTDLSGSITSSDDEFFEGKILTRLHKIRERNRKLVKNKKEAVQESTGTLACEVCGFDFQEFYGEIGDGFSECHHLIPISELNHEKRVSLADLAIVCANCHRMIHRSRPMKSIESMREIIQAPSH